MCLNKEDTNRKTAKTRNPQNSITSSIVQRAHNTNNHLLSVLLFHSSSCNSDNDNVINVSNQMYTRFFLTLSLHNNTDMFHIARE